MLTEHYFKAINTAREAHAAFAVFGGKAPHGHGIVAGGVTMHIDSDKILRFRGYLSKILSFIETVMLPDLELIMKRYPEYLNMGTGNMNYLSVGGFSDLENNPLFPEGVLIQGQWESFDEKVITEDVTTAWYQQSSPEHPSQGKTIPDRSQPKGYSWVKAPRYRSLTVETGPLARSILAGETPLGTGATGRLWARALETRKIANAAFNWLNRLIPGAPTVNTKTELDTGIGIGLHEAMRGSLGHWIAIKNMRITHYQIITPSTWNFSSRDASGGRSIGESSLLGIKLKNSEMAEAGRIIRSLDPCFSCTVHLITGNNLKSKNIIV